MNMIPKEGSNGTQFETIAYGSRETFECEQPRRPAGRSVQLQVRAAGVLLRLQPGRSAGRSSENKLWYFASIAGNRSNTRILDTYFKPDQPLDAGEVPEPAVPINLCQADTGAKLNLSETVRVTHQVTSKHKLRYSFDNTRARQPARQLHDRGREAFAGGGVAPAALADLVRPGAMDGAAHEPPAARGRLRVSARRLPRELPARESS